MKKKISNNAPCSFLCRRRGKGRKKMRRKTKRRNDLNTTMIWQYKLTKINVPFDVTIYFFFPILYYFYSLCKKQLQFHHHFWTFLRVFTSLLLLLAHQILAQFTIRPIPLQIVLLWMSNSSIFYQLWVLVILVTILFITVSLTFCIRLVVYSHLSNIVLSFVVNSIYNKSSIFFRVIAFWRIGAKICLSLKFIVDYSIYFFLFLICCHLFCLKLLYFMNFF